jgi:hypothetical protein
MHIFRLSGEFNRPWIGGGILALRLSLCLARFANFRWGLHGFERRGYRVMPFDGDLPGGFPRRLSRTEIIS